MMTPQHKLKAKFDGRFAEAVKAGESAHEVVLDAHRAFAEDTANMLHLGLRANAEALRQCESVTARVRADQLDTVTRVNTYFLGISEPEFEAAGRIAAADAFDAQLAKLALKTEAWAI